MPHRPTISALNTNAVGILNAIRNNASADYYQAVPKAEQTTESILAVGNAICAFQPRMNEFITALVNRIARVVVTSRMYQNPWAFAKKGTLEFGETIEEVFVDLASAQPFDPVDAASTLYSRTIPDVKSAFHAMNLQVVYPVTITVQQLRQAFTSIEGVTDLISRIVNSLYSANNYDEFIMMKYSIAKLALNGSLPIKTITAVTSQATAEAAIIEMKAATNLFQFMSKEYTIAGNRNFVDKNNVYVITDARFDATTDVDVLAKAFNMDRANWAGRHISIDHFSFNDDEIARLGQLMADDPDYVAFDASDNAALDTIVAIAMDEQFFQIYDNLTQFDEVWNSKGLYWNEFLHIWRTYSASPFVNVLMFSSTTPAVTSVTVNGESAPVAGGTYVYQASMSVGDFTNKGVTWSVAKDTTQGKTPGTGSVTIDDLGRLHVGSDADNDWIITATSVADSTVKGTKAISIA